MKTNAQDFDVLKVSNRRSQQYVNQVYKLSLLTAKTNPNFLRLDKFLCDL